MDYPYDFYELQIHVFLKYLKKKEDNFEIFQKVLDVKDFLPER